MAPALALTCIIALSSTACRPGGSPGDGGSTALDIGGALDCRIPPRFAAAAGFGSGAALTTGDGPLPGLALVDAADPGRAYQHPSWVSHGPMGPLTYDQDGNVYVAPSLGLSLLDSPLEGQSTLYKADSDGGEMVELARLAPGAPLSPDNPFGILGLTYDCDTRSLYAASVAGSTRRQEVGRIARIDPDDGEETAAWPDFDAMGLSVFRGSHDRRLYFGSARRPEIWSVALDERGHFIGPARRDIVLPEWSDRARRVDFDAAGRMEVRAVPFVFNLAVDVDSPQNAYSYQYEADSDTWLRAEEAGKP